MSQQQNGGNNDLEWLLGIVSVVLIVLFLFFKEDIGLFVMKLRYYEAYLLPSRYSDPIFDWIANNHPNSVTFDDISGSGNLVGQIWRWPVCILLIGLGWHLYQKKSAIRKKYGQRHNRKSLMMQESREWNVIRPVIGMDLTNVPLDHPIEGMRQTPRAWGRRNKVVLDYKRFGYLLEDPKHEYVVTNDGKEIIFIDQLKKVLTSQLGRKWEGIEKLKRHEKSLMIAFCAQVRGDTETAQVIINELAVNFCEARDKKDLNLIYSPSAENIANDVFASPDTITGDDDDSVRDKNNCIRIEQVCMSHAYVRTVLMTLLLMARKNGKLPPNWFRWLKTTDRITWYALCDLGLEEEDVPSSIDAAGVRSHWLWERRSRVAILEPQVQQAIPGFVDEINTRMEKPEDEEYVDHLQL